MNDLDLIVLLGPTASGKTNLAVALAAKIDAEIISADSRQVYQNMNIGTGKDLQAYEIGNRKIPYHLIDIRKAGEDYSVAAFQEDFEMAYSTIKKNKKEVILCGGTGMYINAVLQQYTFTAIPINEVLREELSKYDLSSLKNKLSTLPSVYSDIADTSTHKRAIRAIEIATYLQNNPIPMVAEPTKNHLIIGIHLEGVERRKRISLRLVQRLNEGLIDEVKGLLDNGLATEKLIYYGLEYKLITYHLMGKCSKQEMIESLHTAIHQYAKRQMTYFRKMERDGHKIHWIDGTLPFEELVEKSMNLIQAC